MIKEGNRVYIPKSDKNNQFGKVMKLLESGTKATVQMKDGGYKQWPVADLLLIGVKPVVTIKRRRFT